MSAIFRFEPCTGGWKLSNSNGEGMYKFWSDSHFTMEQALNHADKTVGEYIRRANPKSIRYFADITVRIGDKNGSNF